MGEIVDIPTRATARARMGNQRDELGKILDETASETSGTFTTLANRGFWVGACIAAVGVFGFGDHGVSDITLTDSAYLVGGGVVGALAAALYGALVRAHFYKQAILDDSEANSEEYLDEHFK